MERLLVGKSEYVCTLEDGRIQLLGYGRIKYISKYPVNYWTLRQSDYIEVERINN